MARFDEWNGLNWLNETLENGNEGVGRVTVLHIIFMAILMEAAHGNMELAAKMYGILFRPRGEKDSYWSPVEEEKTDERTGLKKTTVWPRLVGKAMEAASSVYQTKETIQSVCKDFVSFGRMFQEKTIDAAKSGEKVVIPYLEQVKQFKLMSRLRGSDDFNVKAVWRQDEPTRKGWKRESLPGGGCIESVHDDGESRWVRLGSAVRFLVKDPFHKASLLLMRIAEEAGLWVTSFRPEFSGVLLRHIASEMQRDRNFRALVKMSCEYKDAYRTVTGCMRKEMREVAESAADPDDRRAWEKVIRKRYRALYAELANEMRRGFSILSRATGASFGTQRRVMANLYASFHDDKGERVPDESASKYADTVMEEEFFIVMSRCMRQKGEPISEWTEDRLRKCDFPEGAVVDFSCGEAELPMLMEDGREEIFTASAEEEIEGRFVIRLDRNGKKVASRKVEEAVKIPAADPSRLVFMTVADESVGSSVNEFVKNATGKEVVLMNYVTSKDGKKTRQAVVMDGKVVTRFRKIDDWEFRNDPKIVHGFEDVYGAKAGTVSKAAVSVQDVNRIPTTVAVIVLENVHDVDPRDYRHAEPMEMEAVKEKETERSVPSFLQRVKRRAAMA